MAAVKLADIIVPQTWMPYVQVRTREVSQLFQSGIVAFNEDLNEAAQGPGTSANIPFFNDLSGVSEVLSDTVPLTVNKVTTGSQISAKHFRGKAWGSHDLVAAIAGVDPVAAIGDLVADWWARDMQKTLLSSLKGFFAAASMSDATVDISITDAAAATAANKISAEATIDAADILGDASGDITAIAVHSKQYHSLLKQDLIQFEQRSEQGTPIRTYLGKRVIVDDSLPRVATTNGFKYTSYLFGDGAVAFGEADAKAPVEMDRDILLGEEYLVNRRQFVLHPTGAKWIGTPAGVSPTNAELETGTNWQAVLSRKNIPIVQLITN